jgi:hypothetical protein
VKLIIEADMPRWKRDETIVVRILAINDSYQPVVVDRRLLIGPTPISQGAVGLPHPVSREPAFSSAEENRVLLNPWGIYGRERSFELLPSGIVAFHGYLLTAATDALLPEGPTEPWMLQLAAVPLEIEISE